MALILPLEVLEIERGASKTEIKKAYHKVLTLHYVHTNHFRQLTEARSPRSIVIPTRFLKMKERRPTSGSKPSVKHTKFCMTMTSENSMTPTAWLLSRRAPVVLMVWVKT